MINFKIKIFFICFTTFLVSCVGENINPDEINDGDVLDLTSYSNPDMDGNWRMSTDGSFNIFIDGNTVKFCNNGENVGHLGPEHMIYIFSEDTIYAPYTFSGGVLNTVAGDPSSDFFDPERRTDWIIDSDFNPCIGNVNGSSFNFSFRRCPPYKYKVYVNDILLFDETTWSSGCDYVITPSVNYTMDVFVRYTYCPHGECAYYPEDFITTTYSEAFQLEELTNSSCNTFSWTGGQNSSNLRLYQIL